MDEERLQRARAALDEAAAEVRHQLEEAGADPDERTLEGGDFDPGFADSAHSTAERGTTLVLIERLRGQLREIRRAMSKIEDGTYGICERCGDPIGPERLEALPYSTLCVRCKQQESA